MGDTGRLLSAMPAHLSANLAGGAGGHSGRLNLGKGQAFEHSHKNDATREQWGG